MAASQGVYITYDANKVQNREDLLDVITDLSPIETPIFNTLGKSKANYVYHEFLSNTVSRATVGNGAIEGGDISFSALTSPTRNVNYVQEIVVPYKVSLLQMESNSVGGDELARQRAIAMKNWKLSMEQSLIWGSGVSGASNTARYMKGLLTVISTNATNASGTSLTERGFNNYLQMAYNNVEDDTYEMYADISIKRTVSSFTANQTRYIQADDQALNNSVAVYQSDVAKMVKLYGHKDLTGSSKFIAIQPRAFRVALLANIQDRDFPASGTYQAGYIRGAGTLEFLYEKAGIVVTNPS